MVLKFVPHDFFYVINDYAHVFALLYQGGYRTGVEARFLASNKFFDNVQNALSTIFF